MLKLTLRVRVRTTATTTKNELKKTLIGDAARACDIPNNILKLAYVFLQIINKRNQKQQKKLTILTNFS